MNAPDSAEGEAGGRRHPLECARARMARMRERWGAMSTSRKG